MTEPPTPPPHPEMNPESAPPEIEASEDQAMDEDSSAFDTDDAETPESSESPMDADEESAESPPVRTYNGSKGPRKRKVVLCPYCGHTQSTGEKCVNCGGLFEVLSRRATQIAMGPWTIRDKAHPFRPGCSYEVLKQMIAAGKVKPTTVLRGPTTRQFWSIARNVPGVAHLLGYCHRCKKHVEMGKPNCANCGVEFKTVRQRNELGLQYPNRRSAEAAQRSLNRHLGINAPEPDNGDAMDSAVLHNQDTNYGEDDAGGSKAGGTAAGTVSSIFAQDGGLTAADSDFEMDAEDTDDEVVGAGANLIGDVLGEDVGNPVEEPEPKVAPAAAASAPASPVIAGVTVTDETTAPHPAALPPRREINWVMWVLVGLNVLVAAAVIAFVATRGGGEG